MTEDIVEFCRAFALTVSAKKTETMCMPPPRTMVRIEAAGQTYKQVQSFTYLGGAVTETPDMSVEIARRYLRELYDQPKVALSLKTRLVKAEAIEALLMDAVGGPRTLRQTTHRIQSGLALHHRGTAQDTRPSDDLVQPCP